MTYSRNLGEFPAELLDRISSYLPAYELLKLQLVCRNFRAAFMPRAWRCIWISTQSPVTKAKWTLSKLDYSTFDFRGHTYNDDSWLKIRATRFSALESDIFGGLLDEVLSCVRVFVFWNHMGYWKVGDVPTCNSDVPLTFGSLLIHGLCPRLKRLQLLVLRPLSEIDTQERPQFDEFMLRLPYEMELYLFFSNDVTVWPYLAYAERVTGHWWEVPGPYKVPGLEWNLESRPLSHFELTMVDTVDCRDLKRTLPNGLKRLNLANGATNEEDVPGWLPSSVEELEVYGRRGRFGVLPHLKYLHLEYCEVDKFTLTGSEFPEVQRLLLNVCDPSYRAKSSTLLPSLESLVVYKLVGLPFERREGTGFQARLGHYLKKYCGLRFFLLALNTFQEFLQEPGLAAGLPLGMLMVFKVIFENSPDVQLYVKLARFDESSVDFGPFTSPLKYMERVPSILHDGLKRLDCRTGDDEHVYEVKKGLFLKQLEELDSEKCQTWLAKQLERKPCLLTSPSRMSMIWG